MFDGQASFHDDDSAFGEALRRVKAEYLEMPGLRLTRDQAARLWAFEPQLCDAVLTALVDAQFLVCTRGARFVREHSV